MAKSRRNFWRLAGAAGCAGMSVMICVHQRHVHLVLVHPATYTSLVHHRCGRLLVACVSWLFVEFALGLGRIPGGGLRRAARRVE
jgi:hypothetical protein